MAKTYEVVGTKAVAYLKDRYQTPRERANAYFGAARVLSDAAYEILRDTPSKDLDREAKEKGSP